jgi:hypothetical protein
MPTPPDYIRSDEHLAVGRIEKSVSAKAGRESEILASGVRLAPGDLITQEPPGPSRAWEVVSVDFDGRDGKPVTEALVRFVEQSTPWWTGAWFSVAGYPNRPKPIRGRDFILWEASRSEVRG